MKEWKDNPCFVHKGRRKVLKINLLLYFIFLNFMI